MLMAPKGIGWVYYTLEGTVNSLRVQGLNWIVYPRTSTSEAFRGPTPEIWFEC